MMLSDLQSKDIINLVDGRRIGTIIDVQINENGDIEELLIQKKKIYLFSSAVINLSWEQIDKIGEDVILVNVSS